MKLVKSILIISILTAFVYYFFFTGSKPVNNLSSFASKTSIGDSQIEENIDSSRNKDKTLKTTSGVLYTIDYFGTSVDVIEVEKKENGEIASETIRLPDGKIRTYRKAYVDGDETGYNSLISPMNITDHPYGHYEMDTLIQLAVQNDREAQLLLANKYEFIGKEKRAIKWYIEAANNGYTIGYQKAASLYRQNGDNILAAAYYLLANDSVPKALKNQYKRRINHLSEEELATAKIMYMNLKNKQ